MRVSRYPLFPLRVSFLVSLLITGSSLPAAFAEDEDKIALNSAPQVLVTEQTVFKMLAGSAKVFAINGDIFDDPGDTLTVEAISLLTGSTHAMEVLAEKDGNLMVQTKSADYLDRWNFLNPLDLTIVIAVKDSAENEATATFVCRVSR